VWRDEGLVDQASPRADRADAISHATMTEESPSLAMAHVSLASALTRLQRYEEAGALLTGSYDIVLKTQGADSAVVRHAQNARSALAQARTQFAQDDSTTRRQREREGSN